MAMFKSLIKKHRPAMLSAALGVTIASSLAMSMTVGQVFAKDHFAAAQRMPTGFDSYLTSIHQIQTGAADDADVRLKGRLTGYLYDNNYEFTDEFGQSIEVELDDDTDWSYVHKDQLIEILGEVERNMFKVKVEAKYYRILEEVHPSMQAQSSDVNGPTPVALSDDEPNSQDTDNTKSNIASALSAMASDDANASSPATPDAPSTGSKVTNDANADAAADADADADADASASSSSADSSAPVLAPLSTAGITETSTTKNVSVKDKVVVSTTTTTIKTVTVSDGTTAAADTEQAEAVAAVTEVAATNSAQSASASSSESKDTQSLNPSDDTDAASAVVTAAKTK